ncbi:hypothetical protein [Methylomarinum vadi]|uniref:hypothetical protein n=1 Tax=Methylomarinum vadi TaxID=438855 RepID=UPI0012693503|nr:hypothetical protein [Methylomarinum vadi]
MNQSHFHWLLVDAGFRDEKELAAFFEVTEKTVRNWKKQRPPKAVRFCLELMSGRLDCLGNPWRGFRLTPEAIESPDGDFIYAHEVRAIGYVYQAAGIERARLCTMLHNTTPIQQRGRRLKSDESDTRISERKSHST